MNVHKLFHQSMSRITNRADRPAAASSTPPGKPNRADPGHANGYPKARPAKPPRKAG